MRDMILVFGFDPDFGNSVARRLRAESVYCKLVPKDFSLEQVRRENPSGLILAGGGESRGERRHDLESLDVRLLQADLPVLALGSAARTLCEAEGGARREDMIEKRAVTVTYRESPLLAGVEAGERWMEHVHSLEIPQNFVPIAEAEDGVLGFAHTTKPLYGLQFLVEKNDPDGITILRNFALQICKCTTWWEQDAFQERAKEDLQNAIGDGLAVCATSGGLDSTVCAMLAQRAVGDKVHCVFVDTGLWRQGEAEWVLAQLAELGLAVHSVDVQAEIIDTLAGVQDSLNKRVLIQQCIDQALAAEAERIGDVKVLLRGTDYSDVVRAESLREQAPCDQRMGQMAVIEPLRDLFRDEVYRLGELMGLPSALLQRQPFPDGGLAERILGQVTPERLSATRAANAIMEAEIENAGLSRKLWKYYAMLASMPGGERDDLVIRLRAVQRGEVSSTPARLPYDLLERTAERIQREVPDITKVVYDVTMSVHAHKEL